MSSTTYREELSDLMYRSIGDRSERQLAAKAQVSPATIGNMKLGRVPSREICRRVAEALHIPLADMLTAAGYFDSPEAMQIAARVAHFSEEAQAEILRFMDEIELRERKEHSNSGRGD